MEAAFVVVGTIFQLCRVHQYLKNGFIFLPSIFALKVFNVGQVSQLLVIWGAFSLVTSAVYIFNDLVDLERDRSHPIKKNRPLPSGKVSKTVAVTLSVTLLVFGVVAGSSINMIFWKVVMVYLFMNVGYSLWIKHIPVVDLLLVSIGFVLRVVLGGLVCQIVLSEWIIIMTFLLALFLITSKRYSELVFLSQSNKGEVRPLLTNYSREFLMSGMAISGAVVIVGYIMYALQVASSSYFYVTSIFVIYGIFRYLQVVFLLTSSEDPTTVLVKDRLLQVSIIGWLLSIIWFIY